MPPLSTTSLFNNLVARNTSSTATTVSNSTSTALQVVCAWPVSGQYGPGSRILYYVLIAACVFARKAEWLKNACLAAALLFPAVAALHGIVIASVHVNGAIDMDVYGAFQLCSIGILAAPITVKLSSTYFNEPGRNTIFVWTGLILAGLLSLTIEFFRIQRSDCTQDEAGHLISRNAADFSYNTSCGLTCSVDSGPHSPLRLDAANNIYVIPVPDRLTFDTAALLAASCCVPAILSLVSMWNKILEINWKTHFGDQRMENGLIEGTNGATVEMMKGVNKKVRWWLTAVEMPVFIAAVLAILILGERNFWSYQVRYQTEPIASIGQWAPIVGTGLAVLGSLYNLLATRQDSVNGEGGGAPQTMDHHHWNYSDTGNDTSAVSSHSSIAPPPQTHLRNSFSSANGAATEGEITPTQTNNRPALVLTQTNQSRRSSGTDADAGNRRKVASGLTKWVNYLGSAAQDRFDYGEFKRGRAANFPEIPGEEQRNPELPQIRNQYNPLRDADGNASPSPGIRTHSRAGSVGPGASVEGGSSSRQRAASPRRSLNERPSLDIPFPRLHSASEQEVPRQRRDTLEVPPGHHGHMRNSLSASSAVSVPGGERSPAIFVSSDDDAHADTSSAAPSPLSPSEPLPIPLLRRPAS